MLENLVLSSTANNNYTMHLVTYNITAQEKELLAQGDVIDLNNKVSSVTLDDAGLLSGIFNKETTITCLEIAISYCKYNNGAHSEGYEENGSQCPGYAEQVIATVGDCDNSSNGNSTGNTDTTSDTTNDPTNTTNNNTNTSTNTTTSNGGGANTPVTSPTFCEGCPEIGENDCLINEALQSQLDSLFGNGFATTDCSIDPNLVPEELRFSSIEEFEQFKNTVFSSFEQESTDNDIDPDSPEETHVSKFRAKFGGGIIIPLYLKAEATSVLDKPETQINEFSLEEVTSRVGGLAAFISWNQDSYSKSFQGNTITVTINGHFDYGITIDFLPLTIDDDFQMIIQFNIQTGEEIDLNVIDL